MVADDELYEPLPAATSNTIGLRRKRMVRCVTSGSAAAGQPCSAGDGPQVVENSASHSPLPLDPIDPTPNMFGHIPTTSVGATIDTIPAPRCQSTSSFKRQRLTFKQVHFAQEALLYATLRNEQEVFDSWYNSNELAEFKKERLKTVTQLKRAGFDTKKIGSKYCLRGFEAYLSVEMNKATKYARHLVINVVLAEQNRQRLHGSLDTELLRDRCVHASQWARDNAHELGKIDATESSQEEAHDNQCMGLPYCQCHASCVLAATYQTPSHIDLVDRATVELLENAIRAVKSLM